MSCLQFATDEDPPLEPVLGVLEAGLGSVPGLLLVVGEPSDVEVVGDAVPVVVAPVVAGATVVVQVVAVGVAVGEAVVPLLDRGVEVSVAGRVAVDDGVEVGVPVAGTLDSDGEAQAALPDELDPVAVPAPVNEVDPAFEELVSAEAPLELISPAPPAVGLW